MFSNKNLRFYFISRLQFIIQKNYFFFLNNKFIVRIKYLKHKKTSLNLIQKIHLNKNFK